MCGIGVVISGAVYLKLMGKIFVFAPTVRSEGAKGRIPRPLVVVHSGKTTMGWFAYCFSSEVRGTREALRGGWGCGEEKARRMACRREMRWTRRVEG